MARRLAVAVALVAFAVCLLCGMTAENSFAEIIRRGLYAMVVTLVVGLVIGAAAQRMLNENLQALEKKSGNSEAKPESQDR